MIICPSCNQNNDIGADECVHCEEVLYTPEMEALANDANVLIGKVLNGKYEVLSILGRGGMGVVYKVRHLILQSKNLFALKILLPDFSTDPQFRSRFLREVEVAMEMTHENIIQIRDFGMTEGHLLFFTMDYFEGESLAALIRKRGPMPPPRAVHLMGQVLSALAEAHKCGVVHRDLKPDNMLVQKRESGDRVKILDFGIAKIMVGGTDGNLTQGSIVGSPKYMSPEQASGDPVDQRSDLYSLGVILYELLTGKVPFDAKSTRTILMKHLTAPVPSFEEMCPGLQVPSRLKNLIFSLLEKDANKRPVSAGIVSQVLDGDDTLVSPPARPRKLSVLRRSAIVGLTAALAAAGWFGLTRVWTPKATAGGGQDGVPSVSGSVNTIPRLMPLPRTSGEEKPAGRLRCRICGKTFRGGEMESNTHHDLPLMEE